MLIPFVLYGVSMKNLFFALLLIVFQISAHAETIKLSSINWPPYTGKSLERHGFISEIVTEAFAAVGHDSEFLYMTWARAYREAQKGTVDGVMFIYHSTEREKYFTFSDKIFLVTEDFITLDSSIAYAGDPSALRKFVIGSLNDSRESDLLQEYGITTYKLGNHGQNVSMLLGGRINIALIPKEVFFYHLNKVSPEYDLSKIKVLQPAFKEFSLHLAFSKNAKNHVALTQDFNRGLKIIMENGTYNRIVAKFL